MLVSNFVPLEVKYSTTTFAKIFSVQGQPCTQISLVAHRAETDHDDRLAFEYGHHRRSRPAHP